MALTTRLRSVLSDARERAGGGDAATPDDPAAGDESPPEPTTGLFECSACGTVYVAEEKSTCSSCDEPVEEVSATLSRE
ncbi:hypothetical protein C475_04905 [Halosimplex carlsbadense 2-9-1]|uniref:Small CPxCG-related zinc finger protein n=1 Tax=Halosimplex carlsbadense 2-9-1 TaxID=797114 RepID=M0CY09_9EURY|nr:hypothetical protein [Halosimplex carlsbadense]ELZ28116.1 hypothetical protein C475_04905 [Halosimplex carlsbadense 2-9-1]